MANIVQYYNDYDEDGRLNRDKAHQLERITSTRYLKRILPPGAKILDCCAGTGYYSFWLAAHGYKVTAGDLIPKHIEIIKSSAKAKLLEDVYLGDVLDMSRFEDASFDVVLCMGAYYHLYNPKDREKCIEGCLRVLKNEGILVVSYINRNALFLNNFLGSPSSIQGHLKIMKNGIAGNFFGINQHEISSLPERFHLQPLANIGVDGPIYQMGQHINSLDERQYEDFLKYHFVTCEQETMAGSSLHGLYFARKM